jgi:methylthioribose-1-phosphate isomerase
MSHDQVTLQAIKYVRGEPLQLLDQLALPAVSRYISVCDHREGHRAIASMIVRGAPAIAITAALSLAVELSRSLGRNWLSFRNMIG